MIGDEFSESAKAVQEVAKTTKAGIEATEKLGSFVSRIIGEPVDEVVGIITDKLKYMRWERQQRLTERAKQFIKEKNIKDDLRIVQPKVALPIIENASLEENDELQDLWAYLIASAVDPNFNGKIRMAFIDIIKQLEVNDVHILNFIYSYYVDNNERLLAEVRKDLGANFRIKNMDGNDIPVSMKLINKELGIDEESYKESIDNLIRVRCVASYISEESVDVPLDDRKFLSPEMRTLSSFNSSSSEKVNFSITYIYDKVCITALGISFARACMKHKTG